MASRRSRSLRPVRLSWREYSVTLPQGDRSSDMTLDDGEKVEAGKTYKVAGWATVNAQSPGPPVWEVVAEYLRDRKSARIVKLNTPKLVNVDGNPGLADYVGWR